MANNPPNNKAARLTGLNPLAYMGVEPLSPPELIAGLNRPPTPEDWFANIGTLWTNEILPSTNPRTFQVWMLVDKHFGGPRLAKWLLLAGGSGNIEFLKGNDGIRVGPDVTNTITTIGNTSVATNPGGAALYINNSSANTLTATISDKFAEGFLINGGTTISGTGNNGIVNINSTAPITLTATAPNTVTIGTNGTIATSYVTNSGTATPSGGVLNVVGGTGITVSGSGNTVTITSLGPPSYSTGTFVPTLSFGGASVGIVYTLQSGKYTQIGNIVYFYLGVAISSKGSSTGTAAIDISGIPFTPIAANDFTVNILPITLDAGYSLVWGNNVISVTKVNITQASTAGGTSQLLADTNFSAMTVVSIYGNFFTS